jgi:tetratricopeptide (TPR) repeat protein
VKTLALLAALALPLAAQTTPPDEAPGGAAPAPAAPASAAVSPASPDLMAPPSTEVKEGAQKAADAVAPKAAAAAAAVAAEPKITVTSPKLEETKPLPEAKKEAPKPESAKYAGPEAEWAFVKAAAGDSDSAVQDASVESLRLFARRFPDSAHAPEALFLLAGLRAKKDWQTAAVALLRVINEYAGSSMELRAKSTYLELVGNKASRRLRPVLNDFVNGGDAADKSDRLSSAWQRVADKAPDAFDEAVSDEIRDFFVRFPEHKDNDKLQAALARLHAVNDRPAAAVVSWRKLLALYPESGLRAKAQLSIGDLYADALRDPKKAIDAYQELIAQYPQSSEVLPALENSARLFEEKLKQYDLSVQMDEQIVKTFPKTTASLKALKAIARLQRDRLSKSDEAIKTLQRLSKMHGGQDGIDALLLAADISRRDLKDYGREAALRHQVADDYSAVKEAPQALYDAAGVYEDDVKDAAKAIATYKEVASKYASHKLAKKASDRADKLAAAK